MAWFLALFFGVILLFAILARELFRLNKKAIKHGYGPNSQLPGHPKATGTLVCVNADAPTLGRSLSFPYAFQVTADDRHVTATYEYRAQRRMIADTVYNGELFLTFDGDKVKGRALMGGLQSVEGTVDESAARLRRGQPKESLLSFLNGPYEYGIRQGTVVFENTTRAGCIGRDSELEVYLDRIIGRVVHGPQKTWAVDVDVSYEDVAPERMALAVILACNDILSAHHGD
ncbi:MAG: hypothetical protein AAFR35_16365 [Pseudomonadota bacterium]